MLMTVSPALREQCVGAGKPLSRGKNRHAQSARSARLAVLQRENGLRARIKKQHLPMKKPFFRFHAWFFSISIRSASARAVFHWWFINF
jgi:hypothetical protein